MKQSEWDEFQEFSYRLSAIFAIFTNTILVLLVVYHSPKSLGTYKYLMICICVFEVIYELLDLASSPDMYTKDSAFLVIVSDKKSPFPVNLLLAVNLGYCACFGTSLAIFAVHFVYRYLVVIGEQIMNHYGIGINEIAYIGPYFYPFDIKIGEKIINWKAIYGSILFIIMISISLFTMIIFGIKAYRTINGALAKSLRSENFKKLQSQLLYALILQTIIPLTLMHLPISICFVIPIFEGSHEVFGRFLTTSIAIYPVLDPLPNMFLIRDFRKALFKKVESIIGWFCSKPKPKNTRPRPPSNVPYTPSASA